MLIDLDPLHALFLAQLIPNLDQAESHQCCLRTETAVILSDSG